MRPVFDLDSSLGEVLLVKHDFGEAVLNLVSNACHAMRQKWEAVGDAYEPTLSVSTRLVDDTAKIRVRDNDPGIADDVVGHIFNPFFSTRDGAVGAGLGLPIAADVARRLGGDLSVDTVYGEYTEFTMTLPATACASGPLPPHLTPLVQERIRSRESEWREPDKYGVIRTLRPMAKPAPLRRDGRQHLLLQKAWHQAAGHYICGCIEAATDSSMSRIAWDIA
ncbi:MAG: ATP-binding protein [Dehalococcoidia bacterium]|nr:ATP-binding protein [Dehalococcoidia bacterium]